MKTEAEKYCTACGKAIIKTAEFCSHCGVKQNPTTSNTTLKINPIPNSSSTTPAENKWIITLLLCWFVGTIGVHRFYTGHIVIGILQILTLGGCGIWWLIDIIMIISGNFKDSDGNPITQR